jgi:serine/threonine protein kinase
MKCGTAARAVTCVEVLECQRVEYYGPDDNDKLLHDIVNCLLNISKSFSFQDIVHGDIKPENLLISGDGGVKKI